MSGNIPLKQQKLVCIKSGNRCAMPDCRKEIVIERTDKDPAAIIGKIAHIKGENPGSARYDANMSDNERNSEENLFLICGDCHTKIDEQQNTYTSDILNKVKKEHEDWIRESTSKEILNVSFAELSIVTKYLVSGSYEISDFKVISPKDKIKKNGLSGKIETLITMGMIQVKQVAEYIDKSIDPEFGERLKQGFADEYKKLKNDDGIEGDNLFMALLDFACGGGTNFREKAAGLSVLVYLFEQCEVFEK